MAKESPSRAHPKKAALDNIWPPSIILLASAANGIVGAEDIFTCFPAQIGKNRLAPIPEI